MTQQSSAAPRKCGNQRRFPRIRKSDQADIRQQLQLQAQAALFARLAIFVLARRLMPRLHEVLISASAASAARRAKSLSRLGEIEELLSGLFVKDHRADGHH